MIFGLFSVAALVGLIVFLVLTIVSFVKEGKKPIVSGQKRYKNTLLFLILTVISFFALVLGVIASSMLIYALSIAPNFM